ncbi:hypothetical protein EYR38_009863 [Pleurotus pulmonarius]|nr:hypothetical protein EYR38_009863 [Pleurotus pulmonarius]
MSLCKGVALVTGASRGIGRAIALRLARDGYALALNDTPPNRPAVAALKAEIEKIKYGGGGGGGYAKAVGVEADVTDEAQVREMVRKTVEELGAVDMVANAGILKARPSLVETSMEDFDETFAVNVRGVFLCYKYAAQQMIAQHQQSLRRGMPPPRGASIVGAASVTSKQALELAPYGIRVNAYAPGLVDTKMGTCYTIYRLSPIVDADVEKIAVESNREHAQYIAEESRNIPLKRLGAPDDVADLVSFLVSDKASYITDPPSRASKNDAGNASAPLKNSIGAITHNNYNCGPGVFNDVRHDQHVRGDQHFRGDQHVHGDQHATTLNFTFNGTASDKEGHKTARPYRAWEQEPYRTIIDMLAQVRQRLLWYAERFDLDHAATAVCDELNELMLLVQFTAGSVEQIREEFPLMFKSSFISRAQQSAFEWISRLKVLEGDVEEFNAYHDPRLPADGAALRWLSLHQRIQACIRGPRAEMTRFLGIIAASHLSRPLDIRNTEVCEFVTRLSLTRGLRNPKVETIWVREPTGLRWFSVPLTFCETWEQFSTVIYEYCKHGPEVEYIRQGNWAIVRDGDNSVIDRTQSVGVLRPEMRFDIGVIVQLASLLSSEDPDFAVLSAKYLDMLEWVPDADSSTADPSSPLFS